MSNSQNITVTTTAGVSPTAPSTPTNQTVTVFSNKVYPDKKLTLQIGSK